MVKTAENREKFATNVVAFIKKYGFDGFDIDWEYPAQRGGGPEDVKNYIELLKTLRNHFDKNDLILSAAVAAAKSSASQSYKISEMSKSLNFINLMAYDLHGAWESQTGLNAPLYSSPEDNPDLSVEAAVKYWLSQGCPKEKLIVGVPLYGRSFTLVDAKSNQIGAPARGPGEAGPITRERGMLGYNEICVKLKTGKWTVKYDKERDVPYAYSGLQWVGYDNVESIRKKAELIEGLDLGGAMVWSIETDDFKGICGEKYPLLKTLNEVLRNQIPEDYPTKPSTGVPSKSTEKSNDPIVHPPPTSNDNLINSSAEPLEECKEEGLIMIPGSCDFMSCSVSDDGTFKSIKFECGPYLCFSPKLKVCDWPK